MPCFPGKRCHCTCFGGTGCFPTMLGGLRHWVAFPESVPHAKLSAKVCLGGAPLHLVWHAEHSQGKLFSAAPHSTQPAQKRGCLHQVWYPYKSCCMLGSSTNMCLNRMQDFFPESTRGALGHATHVPWKSTSKFCVTDKGPHVT